MANLIKVLTDKANAWEGGEPVGDECRNGSASQPIATLALSTFTGVDGEPVSVFRSNTHVDEVAITAALNLRRTPSPSQPTSLLRLPEHVLGEHGIELDPAEPGDTGVTEVDALHVDLRGSAESFRSLAAWLLESRCDGLDLVRRVSAAALMRQYECFHALPGDRITDKARRAAADLIRRFKKHQGST